MSHPFLYRSTDSRRFARRLVAASVSLNTRETYARFLPQIDVWHSSRSLEDSTLAAYRAALDDAGHPDPAGRPHRPPVCED